MKNKAYILIAFLALLVIPTSTVMACGNSSEKEKIEKTSCAKEDDASCKESCCDDDYMDHDGCNGTCDNSCHCPSSINIPICPDYFDLRTNEDFSILTTSCAYIQNAPKPVYQSIWQPPKIS